MKLEKTHIAKRENYIGAVNYYNNNQITIKDCAIKFNLDRHNLSKWIRKNGGITNPHGKQKLKTDIFNIIDTEEKSYWLGFLYADGNLNSNNNTVSLELGLKDENHLIKFNDFLSKEKSIKKDHFRVRCVFRDTQIYNNLIKLGCIPKKSLILNFPNYNQVPKHLMHHFIRGYIDGDGSIYISSNRIHVSVLGTKELLYKLIEEIELPKRNFYKKNKEKDSNCYFFEYSGKNAINFIDYLYKDCNIFLERKYNKYLEYCRLKEKSLGLLLRD